jgi:diaminohydroxyphosphoribosylaminopyrimidine deaminase/5-amino-6-(5-phosphoribosylamino)uracil reductase
VLLGGDRLALHDVGVGTIDDARRLRLTSIERLGADVLFIAHPSEGTL